MLISHAFLHIVGELALIESSLFMQSLYFNPLLVSELIESFKLLREKGDFDFILILDSSDFCDFFFSLIVIGV